MNLKLLIILVLSLAIGTMIIPSALATSHPHLEIGAPTDGAQIKEDEAWKSKIIIKYIPNSNYKFKVYVDNNEILGDKITAIPYNTLTVWTDWIPYLSIGPHTIKVELLHNDIVIQTELVNFSIIESTTSILIPLTDPVIDPVIDPDPVTKKKDGGSNYNPPPTLGVNINGKRIVDDGFSYNGNTIDVDLFHTEYPLITTKIGEKNTVEVIVYEERGQNNIGWVQLFLGVPEVGSPLSEVTGQLILSQSQYEDFIITDKQNLIQNFNATSIEPSKCNASPDSEACLKIIFEYEYREAPRYNIIAVNVMDTQRSSWSHYFNDGVEVIGESLNEPPTDKMFVKTSNQIPGIWLTLTRNDKLNDIWTDQNGIVYNKSKYGVYDRITPYESLKCITPDVLPMNGGTRVDCWWRE